MPTGISNSVITPAHLAQRGTPETAQQGQRSRDTVAAAETSNPQAVLANTGDELIRAPEPETGGQEAQNQQPAAPAGVVGSGGSEPTGTPATTQPTTNPGSQDLGIGGNLDLIG